MLEHRGHVEHLAGRHAVLVEQDRPVLRRLGGERHLDLGVELEAVPLAVLTSGELRMRDEVLAPDQPAQGLELLLLVGRDVEEAIAGAQRAGRARGHVLVAHRLPARTPAISQFDTAQPMATRVDSSIDTSMCSPSPLRSRRNSAAAMRKRRRDAAHGVGDRIADPQRRGRLVAGHAHDAREALDDLVVGRVELERTVLPEPGDRAIDDVMLDLPERRIAQAEPVHDAGPEILHHHVGGGDEPAERRLAPLRALEIDGDRALAGVLRQERRAHADPIEIGIGAELTREIARARHLDLDHVGAELGELIAAEGAGEHVGEIEDARAGQKSAHHSCLTRCSRRRPSPIAQRPTRNPPFRRSRTASRAAS